MSEAGGAGPRPPSSDFRLDAAAVEAALQTAAPARGSVGGDRSSPIALVEVHPQLGSTQDRARELIAAGAPLPAVVLAERQTAGRGRGGRGWSSPAGGVWLTLAAALPADVDLAAGVPFSITAALAVARALERACPGLAVGLKWPNDLFAGGRKLGGLLIDLVHEPRRDGAVLVGIGLNVRDCATELPPDVRALATSVEAAIGAPPPPRAELAAAIALALFDAGPRRSWMTDPAARASLIAEAWSRSVLRGRQFRVEVPAREGFVAEATGLAEDGRLIVRAVDTGRVERLLSAHLVLL